MDFFYYCPFCENEISVQSNLNKPKQTFCPACERFYRSNDNGCHYYSCLIPNRNQSPHNDNQSCINFLLPFLFTLLLPWCNCKHSRNCRPIYHTHKRRYKCKKNM